MDIRRNVPGSVSRKGDIESSGDGGNNFADEPAVIIQASQHTSIGRVRQLDNISRCSRTGNGYTETDEKSTSQKLAKVCTEKGATG